jgi:hypothetical protein
MQSACAESVDPLIGDVCGFLFFSFFLPSSFRLSMYVCEERDRWELVETDQVDTRSRYQKTELVEINSHSLFSKWFSESGKLVHSLFTKIEQIAENADVFVLVLIGQSLSLSLFLAL